MSNGDNLPVNRARPSDAAVATISEYLGSLRLNRPSVALAKARSAKARATIQRILEGANAVFLREGHAGLSFRKVSEECGVATGNINYYFPSKYLLLEATLKEALADFVEAHILQFEANRDSPFEILLNVVEFYVAESPSNFQLFYQMWGWAASDERAKDLVRGLYRPIGRFVYYLVRASNEKLSDIEVRRAVFQIFALEEGMKLFIGMGPDDDPALAYAREDIRLLTKRIVGL